jgi:hypothetical protein
LKLDKIAGVTVPALGLNSFILEKAQNKLQNLLTNNI